jgi:hypothetical protein
MKEYPWFDDDGDLIDWLPAGEPVPTNRIMFDRGLLLGVVLALNVWLAF